MEAIVTFVTSPVFLLALGGILLVVWRMRGKPGQESKQQEPSYIKQVRAWVSQGNFKEAADLQARHGNLEEAFNLYQKSRSYEEASEVAEKLGWLEQAARMAEKAKDFQRAADLYMQLKRPHKASQVCVKEGNYERAAQLMEQSAANQENQEEQLARMWEKALLSEAPAPQAPHLMQPEDMQKMQYMAQKAATYFEKAGNHQRALRLYEMSQQHDKAAALRKSLRQKPQANQPAPEKDESRGQSQPLPEEQPSPVSQPDEELSFVPLGGSASLSLDESPGCENYSASYMPQSVSHSVPQMPQSFSHSMPQIPQSFSHSMPQLPQPLSQSMPSMSCELPLFSPSTSLRTPFRRSSEIQLQPFPTPPPYAHTSLPIHEENQRYTLGEKIGEGGMATVHKAFDQKLERDVALKLLSEALALSEEELRYFEEEAKAAATLNHPNIVTIYDYGILNHRPFICMELIDGATLGELLEYTGGEGLPLLAFLEVADGLLQALAFAHSHDFVHRDVKPANVMYTSQSFIKLMDFGIARQGNINDETIIAGTPRYMAPEQMVGSGVDHRSDLFAVGATLYELATCAPAFEGLSREKLPPPPSYFREFPPQIEAILLWCLHRDPDKRPQSAKELRTAIKKVRKELEKDPFFGPELEPDLLEA